MFAQRMVNEQHIGVAMRLIGHELLLLSGDSSSRVLPISNEQHTYKIQFSSPFQFEPDQLSTTVDQVIQKANITDHYIIEVVSCVSEEVVYAYEVKLSGGESLVPCLGRMQPEACYSVHITIIEDEPPLFHLPYLGASTSGTWHSSKENKIDLAPLLLMLPILLSAFLFVLLRRKNTSIVDDNDLIQIGKFLLDRKNLQLKIKGQEITLTSKETALLVVLYEKINTTIKRENLLKEVWEDDGDYIGRTLDVYISKLRKKLEADQNLKIINTRGVGYRLINNG